MRGLVPHKHSRFAWYGFDEEKLIYGPCDMSMLECEYLKALERETSCVTARCASRKTPARLIEFIDCASC